jgi:hypothetical protein
MNTHIDVYVGNFGEFRIPSDVVEKARAENGGRSLTDRRTKGAKRLAYWGKCKDLEVQNHMLFDKILAGRSQK